jgi:hypothetical protein
MIHYHGGPITPESVAEKAWRGRHAFISWVRPDQIELAASICQSFALDNGTYSLWQQHRTVDWHEYYRWAEQWLRHPACDWAVIPDVIDGTEEENDALLAEWPFQRYHGVPVWHLNESIERLVRLAEDWPRVALGSTAEYDVRKPANCIDRLRQALASISVDGVPMVKVHGLRMLNPSIITAIPLSSTDSTNVARNVGLDVKWKGTYPPATRETRAQVLVERIEHYDTPANLKVHMTSTTHPQSIGSVS